MGGRRAFGRLHSARLIFSPLQMSKASFERYEADSVQLCHHFAYSMTVESAPLTSREEDVLCTILDEIKTIRRKFCRSDRSEWE